MTHDDFYDVFQAQVADCERVLAVKSKEYSTHDKLHNFKVAAGLQSVTTREALGGMMAKHVVSIYDLISRAECADIEMWDEKLGDALNYLFLLKAIVVEELDATPVQTHIHL